MKYSIINILLLLLFVISCDKEDYSNGFATAEINGVHWKSQAFGGNLGENRIGVNFVIYKKGIKRESMGFQFIPKVIGTYAVDFISTDTLFLSNYATISDDGDVTKDFYYLEKSNSSNYVSIDELTETMFSGEFDLTFTIDTTRVKVDPNAPDIIHFSNGEFYSKIN